MSEKRAAKQARRKRRRAGRNGVPIHAPATFCLPHTGWRPLHPDEADIGRRYGLGPRQTRYAMYDLPMPETVCCRQVPEGTDGPDLSPPSYETMGSFLRN
jgi:hypothetical protein